MKRRGWAAGAVAAYTPISKITTLTLVIKPMENLYCGLSLRKIERIVSGFILSLENSALPATVESCSWVIQSALDLDTTGDDGVVKVESYTLKSKSCFVHPQNLLWEF